MHLDALVVVADPCRLSILLVLPGVGSFRH